MRRVSVGLALSCAALFGALPAAAQDVATSAALFDKGVSEMNAGTFDTACPTLAESLRIDPRPGTLFTLAECYAKAGKTASAVARYQEYLNQFGRMTPEEQAKQNGRDQRAAEQRDKLAPSVPTLTLKLPDGAPAGTEVKRDGTVLAAVSLGLALPVDPGPHTVTVQPPGGALGTETLTIADGEKKEVTLTLPAPGTTSTSPPSTGAATPPSTTPPSDDASRGNTQRIAGIVVGSVGIAGLIVGGITGGLTLGQKSTVTDNCNATTKTCNQKGFDAMNSAKTTGAASTALFIIGGLATATGIVVFFTAPKASATAHVGLAAGPTHLSIVGSF